MTRDQFIYWLQGWFEMANPVTIDDKQTELIKRHLAMVFIHDIDKSYPEDQQNALNEAHSGNLTDIKPQSPTATGKPKLGGKGLNDIIFRC